MNEELKPCQCGSNAELCRGDDDYDDFEKSFILGIRRAVGIIKDGGWE